MVTGSLRKIALQFSKSRAFQPVLGRLEQRGRKRSSLRVLAYHRIDEHRPNDPYYPGLISAAPQQFAQQLEFVASHYSVCSMEDVVAASKGITKLPTDSVLLTFDDATTDFALHAWPVLKSLGLPATVFVPTAYPDNPAMSFWWDKLYRAVIRSPEGTKLPTPEGVVTLQSKPQRVRVFRRFRDLLKNIPHEQFRITLQEISLAAGVADPSHNNVLGWAALRQLDREGVTLAPHTHTHPMLNQISQEEVRDELRISCTVLEAKLGRSVSRTLAYPAGGVSDDVVATMASEGFDLAFGTQRGVNPQSFANPFRLRRINVGAGTNLALLRLQLANWGK
jgi:peptidoglycan/xylan/chitin deacetylase (PgdA/CDA1 family)